MQLKKTWWSKARNVYAIEEHINVYAIEENMVEQGKKRV